MQACREILKVVSRLALFSCVLLNLLFRFSVVHNTCGTDWNVCQTASLQTTPKYNVDAGHLGGRVEKASSDGLWRSSIDTHTHTVICFRYMFVVDATRCSRCFVCVWFACTDCCGSRRRSRKNYRGLKFNWISTQTIK